MNAPATPTTPTATPTATRRCAYCDKQGLALLPVRYTLAPDDLKMPPLPAALLAQDSQPTPVIGPYRAITRQLRAGFLYVFDEKRNEWHKYLITEDGYYLRQAQVVDTTPPLRLSAQAASSAAALPPARQCLAPPCNDPGHREIASCITLRSPKEAGLVWLAFSDVEWTARILQQHASVATRRRHMRCLDVQAWLSGQHPHAQPLTQLAQTVAEYAPTLNANHFSSSAQPYTFRSNMTVGLLVAATQAQGTHPDNTRYAPLILAIDDPVGVCADLAARMDERIQHFLDAPQPVRHYKNFTPRRADLLAISATIEQLHQGIDQAAEDMMIQAARNSTNRFEVQGNLEENDYWARRPKDPARQYDYDMAWFRRQEERARRIEAGLYADPKDIENYQKVLWADYTGKFRHTDWQNWQKTFQTDLHTFSQRDIAPLGQMHRAWLTSTHMFNHMDCNYDDSDARSGRAYTTTLALCTAGTQNATDCLAQYTQWLDGSLTDKTNLLMRALVFNHSAQASHLASVLAQAQSRAREQARYLVRSPATLALPWDGLIGGFASIFGDLARDEAYLPLAFLFGGQSGAFSQHLNRLDGRISQTLLAWGVVHRTPIVSLEITGTIDEFEKMLNTALQYNLTETRIMGPMDMRQLRPTLQRRIEQHTRTGRIAGNPTEKPMVKRFNYALTEDVFKMVNEDSVLKNLPLEEKIDYVLKRVRTPQDVTRTELLRSSNTWKGTTLSFGLGLGALLFQQAALHQMEAGQPKAMMHQAREISWRMEAMQLFIFQSANDLVSKTLLLVNNLTRKTADELVMFFAKGFEYAAKLVGTAALGIGVWFDIANAWDAWHAGKPGLVMAYTASAAVGVGLALAMWFSWTGVGLILTAAMIGLGFLIAWLQTNRFQDWLERGYWGSIQNTEQFYINAETELKQFTLAGEG